MLIQDHHACDAFIGLIFDFIFQKIHHMANSTRNITDIDLVYQLAYGNKKNL